MSRAIWLNVCLVVSLSLAGCIFVANPNPQPADSVVDNSTPPPPPPPPVDQQPPYQPPPPEVVNQFQPDLAPFGRWIVVDRYGPVWQPFTVPDGWQPYTVGHWVYTDDGATWVSEPVERDWGCIVFHYGQWCQVSGWNWVWVPGNVWAPAWVSWREGGGYCGWAPLPPEACQQQYGPAPSGPIVYQDVDRYTPPDRYVYVDERNINEVDVHQQIVHNNVTIIHQTTNITNVTVVNNRVINQGVPRDHIERATGHAVQSQAVAEVNTTEQAHDPANIKRPVRYVPPARHAVPKPVPTPVMHAPPVMHETPREHGSDQQHPLPPQSPPIAQQHQQPAPQAGHGDTKDPKEKKRLGKDGGKNPHDPNEPNDPNDPNGPGDQDRK